MNDIICLSNKNNALILQSIGVMVIVQTNPMLLSESYKEILQKEPKIIIIDISLSKYLSDIIKKTEEMIYPIILWLPFTKSDMGKNFQEIEVIVEHAIGISVT